MGARKSKFKRQLLHDIEFENSVWEFFFGEAQVASCFSCGAPISKKKSWRCSYIIPLSKGGSTKLYNIRVCCLDCPVAVPNMDAQYRK